MVEITTSYVGQLRCKSIHGPSGNVLETDAPVDNNGKGETFSPTDLVATALGSCMLTIMGIVADRRQISLEGLTLKVQKVMSEDAPRRIAKLPVRIEMPLPADSPLKDLFINAALTCPVHQSLHSSIEIPIDWVWQ
ncbi:OsmC family protein [Rubritalea tangerina]|uniref:OsmC family protein n=1 Tax=Rubritalea tangerina TaxID=430798 RepID=A0ABW4ZGX6_9BACT